MYPEALYQQGRLTLGVLFTQRSYLKPVVKTVNVKQVYTSDTERTVSLYGLHACDKTVAPHNGD